MTDSRHNEPPDIQRDIAAATELIDHQHAERRSTPAPRRQGKTLLSLSLAALAATLWFARGNFVTPPMVPEEELAIMTDNVAFAREVIERHRDSTGAVPASLEVVYLSDLPVSYVAADSVFRLVGVTTHGDTVRAQGAARRTPR